MPSQGFGGAPFCGAKVGGVWLRGLGPGCLQRMYYGTDLLRQLLAHGYRGLACIRSANDSADDRARYAACGAHCTIGPGAPLSVAPPHHRHRRCAKCRHKGAEPYLSLLNRMVRWAADD